MLMELFQTCPSCLSKNMTVKKMRPMSFGSLLKIESLCHDCCSKRDWYSQPKIGSIPAGNLLLSSAILYGGGSPTKFLRILQFCNIIGISLQCYMDHQATYHQPAIIRVWERQQRHLLQQIPDGEKVTLGGDGRADSPGHSAKYGAYTLMDMERSKVMDVQLVQVSFC